VSDIEREKQRGREEGGREGGRGRGREREGEGGRDEGREADGRQPLAPALKFSVIRIYSISPAPQSRSSWRGCWKLSTSMNSSAWPALARRVSRPRGTGSVGDSVGEGLA